MDTVLAWIAAALAAVVGLFTADAGPDRYFGYVEADYVIVAPVSGGTVARVMVDDGDAVAADAPLIVLDTARQDEAVAAATARVESARASLRDLESGSRPEELAVINERWRSALDNLRLAQETFDRTEALSKSQVIAASRLDADRAALNMARAEVARIEAELKVARLPARDARIEAARHDVEAAEAELSRAEIDLADRTLAAPVAGRVDRVFVDPGEYVAAGTPTASLLPPGAIKVRFFVPEPELRTIAPGDAVLVGCTACAEPYRAKVSWIGTEAEHTPPIIYSREERAKLVFPVEARFDEPPPLGPGQPVDVRPAP